MPTDPISSFASSFGWMWAQSSAQVAVYLPRIGAALLILILGAAAARALKAVLIKVLETLRVTQLVEKTPIEHFLVNADIKHKVEVVIGSIVYWLVMLVVLQSAASVLGLAGVASVLASLLNYIPQIISAIFVMFFGVLLAGVVESLVKGAIKSVDGKAARLLGKISSYLVVTISVLAAISELGIASMFITILLIGFVTALSLGFGLALGLGGQEVVREVLRGWYSRVKDEVAE